MRKRMWKSICCALVLAALSLSPTVQPASAACGTAPPLPPDGLIWPAPGAVVNGWSLDCRTDTGHRGMDISAAAGVPVRAASGGVVVFTGFTPAEGGGTTVSIEHPGGLRSTYLHLVQPLVSSGQQVSQGQTLAFTGSAPLHFGLKAVTPREVYFDPQVLLSPPVQTPADPPVTAGDSESSTVLAPEAAPPAPAGANPVAAPMPAPDPAASPAPNLLPGVAPPAIAPVAEDAARSLRLGAPGSSIIGNGSVIGSRYASASDLTTGITAAQPLTAALAGGAATSASLIDLLGFTLPGDLRTSNAVSGSPYPRLIAPSGAIDRMSGFSWRGPALAALILLLAAAGRTLGRMAMAAPASDEAGCFI